MKRMVFVLVVGLSLCALFTDVCAIDVETLSVDTLEKGLGKRQFSINEIDREQLSLLPFLDAQDVEKIWRYRVEKGGIYSSHELMKLLDLSSAELLAMEELIVFPDDLLPDITSLEILARANSSNVAAGSQAITLDAQQRNHWFFGLGLARYPRYYLIAQQYSRYNVVQKREQYYPEYLGLAFHKHKFSISIGDYSYHNGLGLLIARSTTRSSIHNGAVFSGLQDNSNGRFTPISRFMRGVMLHTREASKELSFYSSYKLLDLYQYRLRHIADAWTEPVLGVCDAVATRQGYYCEDGVWYDYVSVDKYSGEAYQYIYLQNRLLEEIYGLAIRFSRTGGYTRFSLQHLQYTLAGEGRAFQLSPASPYSNIHAQNYVGVYDSQRYGNAEWQNELVLLHSTAFAYTGSISIPWHKNLMSRLSVRYIPPDYRNPLAKIDAMPDLEDGLRYINEQGMNLLVYCRYCHYRWQVSAKYKAPINCTACENRQETGRIYTASLSIGSRLSRHFSWRIKTSSFGEAGQTNTYRQAISLRNSAGRHLASIKFSESWLQAGTLRSALRGDYRYTHKNVSIKAGLANTLEVEDEPELWFDTYKAYIGVTLRADLFQLELRSYLQREGGGLLDLEHLLVRLKMSS